MPSANRIRSAATLRAMGAGFGAPAHAATFCADTPQELVLALASAAQSAEDDEIRGRAGTLTLTSNITLTFNGELGMNDGWSLNCLLRRRIATPPVTVKVATSSAPRR